MPALLHLRERLLTGVRERSGNVSAPPVWGAFALAGGAVLGATGASRAVLAVAVAIPLAGLVGAAKQASP